MKELSNEPKFMNFSTKNWCSNDFN